MRGGPASGHFYLRRCVCSEGKAAVRPCRTTQPEVASTRPPRASTPPGIVSGRLLHLFSFVDRRGGAWLTSPSADRRGKCHPGPPPHQPFVIAASMASIGPLPLRCGLSMGSCWRAFRVRRRTVGPGSLAALSWCGAGNLRFCRLPFLLTTPGLIVHGMPLSGLGPRVTPPENVKWSATVEPFQLMTTPAVVSVPSLSGLAPLRLHQQS